MNRATTAGMNDAIAALVRRHDPDRFLTALFAPAERRDALLALYAFNHELARAREVASEPPLALIRLQWWREVVEGEAKRHEVATPLSAAIAAGALTARRPAAGDRGARDRGVWRFRDRGRLARLAAGGGGRAGGCGGADAEAQANRRRRGCSGPPMALRGLSAGDRRAGGAGDLPAAARRAVAAWAVAGGVCGRSGIRGRPRGADGGRAGRARLCWSRPNGARCSARRSRRCCRRYWRGGTLRDGRRWRCRGGWATGWRSCLRDCWDGSEPACRREIERHGCRRLPFHGSIVTAPEMARRHFPTEAWLSPFAGRWIYVCDSMAGNYVEQDWLIPLTLCCFSDFYLNASLAA